MTDPKPRSRLDSQQFIRALNLMLDEEGGYSNRPRREDPGGPTYRGITRIGHEEYHRPASRGGRKPGSASHPLTNDEVRAIYHDIWTRNGAQRAPAGMDEVILNTAVMSGDPTLRNLQREGQTPEELLEAHRAHLRIQPNFPHNPGWMPRLDRLRARINPTPR